MTSPWPTLALEELASVQRGKFSARPRNDPKYYGGCIPFIQTGDVANGAGRVRTYSQTLNDAGLSVSKLFPRGSLVVTIAANIGDVARVEFDFACPDSLVVVQANEGVNSDWLQYSLESKKELLDSLAPQNAQKNINLEVLRPLSFDVPPLGEQQRIAGALGSWDTAIQKTEQLIVAQELRLAWMMRRLYDPKPHWKPSCLGDVLAPTKRLHGNGKYEIGSVGKRGIRLRSEIYSKNLSATQDGNILVEPDWVCFGLSTDSIAYGVNRTSRVYSVSPAYRTYEITGADPGFIEGHLKAFNAQLSKRFLIISARQGKAIDFDGLLNARCYFPPTGEQRLISKTLTEAQEAIEKLREIADRYRAQKRGLMQKLLTGKWRLPVRDEETA